MKYSNREEVEIYACPTEVAGEIDVISTDNITSQQFTELREQQNVLMVEGDLGKHFENPSDAPLFVCAAIGASTVPSLMGTSTYAGTKLLDVWREKLGIQKREISPALQKVFDAGHKMELPIAETFCERNYLTLLRPAGMYVSRKNNAYFVNIDYYAKDKADEVVILEIKYCAGKQHQHEVLRRVSMGLPAEAMYEDQVQYQMAVSGVHKGYVVYGWCHSPKSLDNSEIDITYGFEVKYDQNRVDEIFRCVDIFVESLVKVDETLLAELPGSTPEDYTAIYGEGEGELVEDDAEYQAAADKLIRARNAKERAEELEAEALVDLRKLTKGYKRLIVKNGSTIVDVTTKVQEKKTWDLEKLKDELPEVYEKNIKFSITEAGIEKLPDDVKETVLSCLTVTRKPVNGVTAKIIENT